MKHKQLLALMGKVVTVTSELRLVRLSRYDGQGDYAVSTHTWERCDCPTRSGWVVGYRILQNGKNKGYNEEAHLEIESTVSALLVCYWPTMKPVFVPVDAFTDGGEPYLFTAQFPDRWRKSLSDDSKFWPRDSRGRWKKWGAQ